MNLAHFHLAICHVPVVGMLFACVGLLIAVIRNEAVLSRWVLGLAIIVGLSALPVTWSGEKAEDQIESLPGMSMDMIEAHEESAETSLALTLTTAGIAAAGLVAGFLRPKLGRAATALALLVGLAASVSMAQTANLGGQIRHTEIRPASGETN